MIYLIDSNIYIRAFNDIAFGPVFREFHRKHLPRLILSAVVVHELLIGAHDSAQERALYRGIVEPFRSRRRLHVPERQTWETAASVDRHLRKRKNLVSKLQRRSFFNDILIAVSARERGATIVTENQNDFRLINEVLEFKYVGPWPGSAE